jgi:hypothetical protein
VRRLVVASMVCTLACDPEPTEDEVVRQWMGCVDVCAADEIEAGRRHEGCSHCGGLGERIIACSRWANGLQRVVDDAAGAHMQNPPSTVELTLERARCLRGE